MRRHRGVLGRHCRGHEAAALVAPAAFFMLVVHLAPTAAGIYVALLDVNLFTFYLLFRAPFVGLENFRSILFEADNPLRPGFLDATRITPLGEGRYRSRFEELHGRAAPPLMSADFCVCLVDAAEAKALMRAMNSDGVFASRSCTAARPKPPSMKWMCESMNPGTSIIPRASITRAFGPASFRISALDPTAASRSPSTAMASAHGRCGSPVHARALTTASETVGVVMGALAQLVATRRTKGASRCLGFTRQRWSRLSRMSR